MTCKRTTELNVSALAELMRVTDPALWEPVLPGETPHEFCARVDARADIAADVLDELAETTRTAEGQPWSVSAYDPASTGRSAA